MQIDLRTVTIEPKRQAYDHLVRRFGDKPASRYQEGSYDIQAEENLHYRPTWDPEQELYDATLSRIRMADWYAIKDQRQFYYSTYTLTRARQQDAAEMNFDFVESHDLLGLMEPDQRALVADLLVPLRHAAWGANQNNAFVCGYGFGTTFTQPCMYHAMDNLGIAQYLSRLGLLLDGLPVLDAGRAAWQEGAAWQELRRFVEDVMANRDPVEVFFAQNVALDGLLYPLVYEWIVDEELSRKGASAVAMLTQFQSQWFAEGRKWIDVVLKAMTGESEENRSVLKEWADTWTTRAGTALLPVVEIALGDAAAGAVDAEKTALTARLAKTGIA